MVRVMVCIINENPTPDLLPNQVYSVGEVVKLRGSDGIIYLYTITSLSDNGNEVTGDLKREDGKQI